MAFDPRQQQGQPQPNRVEGMQNLQGIAQSRTLTDDARAVRGGIPTTIQQTPIAPQQAPMMQNQSANIEQAVDIWDGGVGSLHEMLFTPSPELDNDSLATLAVKPFVKKGVEEAKKEIKVASLQSIGMGALGFNPDTATPEDGGLIGMAAGGNFQGQVQGSGHGMEDNVYMPIVERNRGQQVATLAVSPDEYVVDAHTMSALGNGSADAGAKVMDNVVDSVREKAYGTDQQPNEINGLAALRPMIERV